MRKALLALMVVFAAGCNQTTREASQPASPKPAPVTAVPTAPSSTASQPKPVKVPNVVGQDLSKARSTLRHAGLSVDSQTKETSAARGSILSQSPQNGKALPGEPITIVVAIPLPLVPNVVGKDVKVATRALDNAGFNVHVKKQGSSAPQDQVLTESPAGGTQSHSGRTVKITIAKPLPKPTTPSSGGGGGDGTSGGNCTPGYSPCLPPAPDYDCAGGSGDGPKYTGTVHVTGSDPYDLDADGDGIGCET
jgi:hypothetical protein